MAADTITINNKVLPYPAKFPMQRVPNIVAELRTMSGQDIADVNGWKWADTTIAWGAMLPDDLDTLILAVQGASSFQITFLDAGGTSRTVNAVLRGFGHAKMRYKNDGSFVWEDVSVDMSFPDCYQY